MSSELGALVGYLGRERRAIVGTVVLVTVSLVTLGVLAVLPAYALGRVVVEGTLPPAWSWAALAGLVVLRGMLTWAEMDASHSLAYRVLARLRMALFDRYAVALPTRRRENVGHAAATAMADTERLEFFYAHTVAQLVAGVVNLVAGLLILAVVHPPLALVVLAAAAVLAVTGRVHAGHTRALGREVADRTSALSGRVVDVLGGLREVLGYRLQEPVRAEVAEAGVRVAEAAGRLETATRMLTAVREAAVTVAAAAVLAVAAFGGVAPALVPAVVVLALVTIAPAADAAATIAQLHPLRASAARVRDELQRPAVAPLAPAPGAVLPEGPLGLAIRDVTFAYADHPVLDGFCLEVEPGEHVALTGPSGVGKSTVVALAGRLWDPDAGEMVLTGASGEVPLRALADAELRRTVAVVEQDGRLFSGTVAENLLVHGRSSRADLIAGLETLDLAQVIGPDEQLGEGGVRLSGGQQARLRLLRAILARPRVLVVDEPTADLDPASAAKVHDILYSLPCTLLVVSHQEKTLTGADRVVSLEGAENVGTCLVRAAGGQNR
jgi:ATP-binding cassette, subfamily C, bacterial CydC